MIVKEELVKLIYALMAFPRSENQDSSIRDKIDDLSPDPEWDKHVFRSIEFIKDDGMLDVDAVVEKIMSFKPIQLRDRSNERIE